MMLSRNGSAGEACRTSRFRPGANRPMTENRCVAEDFAVQQDMLRSLWPHLTMFCLALCCLGQVAASPSEANRLRTLLAAMHPDHARYIQSVRSAPAGVAPADLYLGLVP